MSDEIKDLLKDLSNREWTGIPNFMGILRGSHTVIIEVSELPIFGKKEAKKEELK